MSITKRRAYRIKNNRADQVFNAFNLAFWLIALALVLYPLWIIIIASVSNHEAVISGRVMLLPVDFSLMGYEAVFQHQELWTSYGNAVYYTVLGSGLSVMVTMMAAYALSRRIRGKGFFSFIFVFTMFFTGGLIPTFLSLRDLGLYNTRLVLILFNCVSVWNLMVARTYLQTTIPDELYEAAVIDGANHFSFFMKIILPLSGTIIAVLSVYYGVARWNDYFTALVYIRDRSKLPLQNILREILATTQSVSTEAFFSAYSGDATGMNEAIRRAEVAKYCVIVVSTAPAVFLYLFMQKYFVKGVMIGSVKG